RGGDAGRTRRGDVRAAASRIAPARPGGRSIAGRCLAGFPRWRQQGRARPVFRWRGARAARRRVPPRDRRGRGGGAAAARAPTLSRADGGAAMSASWPALGGEWFAGFAWPWLLLALLLPWLVRRLL